MTNDVAILKVRNHTFASHQILPPCPFYVTDCTILGFCGTGSTHSNTHWAPSKSLQCVEFGNRVHEINASVSFQNNYKKMILRLF